MAGVLSIVMTFRADGFDVKLIGPIVAVGVVVFVPIVAHKNFIGAVCARKVLRVWQLPDVDQMVDTAARLPLISIACRLDPSLALALQLQCALADAA
jgi:uncharacterized oligopeptide transporter (OPT) family protein